MEAITCCHVGVTIRGGTKGVLKTLFVLSSPQPDVCEHRSRDRQLRRDAELFEVCKQGERRLWWFAVVSLKQDVVT